MVQLSKLEIYKDVAQDLVIAILGPFLPYDEGLNPVGDKISSKNEIFVDFGLLTVSIDTDENLLQAKADLLKISGDKTRHNTVKKKSEACTNALEIVLHQTTYKECATPGRLIKSLMGSITEEDSSALLQFLESEVIKAWNAVYDVSDSLGGLSRENETKRFSLEESKMFIRLVFVSSIEVCVYGYQTNT